MRTSRQGRTGGTESTRLVRAHPPATSWPQREQACPAPPQHLRWVASLIARPEEKEPCPPALEVTSADPNSCANRHHSLITEQRPALEDIPFVRTGNRSIFAASDAWSAQPGM